MAIFTRRAGDAQQVRNVGSYGTLNANASIINTGLNAPVTCFKVSFIAGTANLAAELGTGGAVETIIRTLSSNAQPVMYQVDAGTSGAQQVSILAERSAMSATELQTILQAAGNIGGAGNVYGGAAQVTVTSSGGFKLA
jgi:hypothetical protein